MTRFVWAGFVDVDGLHEMAITPEAAGKARGQGWLVLDEHACPTPAHVRTKPDATGHSGGDDDDGA